MRIDAHHHLWDLSVRDQAWTADLPSLRRSFHLEDLRPELARSGIDATILVQTGPVAEETEEFLRIADAAPEVAGVVGWVDLEASDIEEKLTRLQGGTNGGWLVGVRAGVQDLPDGSWLTLPDTVRGLRALDRASLCYDLLIRADQISAATRAVRQVPGLKFVLDHGAKPDIAGGNLAEWRRDIELLAAEPNVAVKLSGLTTEAGPGWTTAAIQPYADVLLAAFGPDRAMFGSDWPVCLINGSYAAVFESTLSLLAQLTSEEQVKVLGRTAEDWYGIPTTRHHSES